MKMETGKAITIIEAVIAGTADAFISEEAIHEALWMGISALEEQERDKWVPCSDRMPEGECDVLVTDKFGEVAHAVYLHWDGDWRFVSAEEYMMLEDVKAWKPVPEPYEEGKK